MDESELRARCTAEQLQELQNLSDKYREGFSNASGVTDLTEHVFELIEEKPVIIIPYRASQMQKEIIKKEIKRMLELNIINKSDFNTPVILVEAPGKAPRPCVDYKKLNAITKSDIVTLPNIEESGSRQVYNST